MLNQNFNPKPKPLAGPRQSGQTVSNPKAILAIALKNNAANNAAMAPSPLAQAIAKRKKKNA